MELTDYYCDRCGNQIVGIIHSIYVSPGEQKTMMLYLCSDCFHLLIDFLNNKREGGEP